MDERDEIINNDNLIIETLSQWVLIEHERKDFLKLIKEMGYCYINIYGYGTLGKLFEKVLKDSDITVVHVVDQKFRNEKGYFLSPENILDDADAVIVTNIYYFEEIRDNLRKKGIISDIRLIDELLYQL